ncbi:MAG: MFS transporter [Acidimicrobiales bacterium]
MPKVLADITPLRASADFRRLYVGQMISFLGSQLTVVAVPVQVYALTGSSFAVGLVSLAQLGPLLVGSLVGGAVADAMDRRRLLLVMQVALALTSVPLAVNAMRGDKAALWPVVVFSALAAGFSGVERPARSAAIPSMFDDAEMLPAAYALWQILIQVGSVVGPALSGILLGQVGLAGVYWIDVVSFAAAFVAVLRLRPLAPEGGGTRAGVSSIAEGLGFLKGRRVIQGVFLVDINAMVFGMPRALFPALGTGLFGGGELTVGLLFAAPGAGALVGALFTGWVSRVRRQGRAVVIAVVAWGVAIAGFGLAKWLPLGLLLLAVAGAADVVSAVFRNTVLQTRIPDALRGRLSAIQISVVTGGPRVGDLESGSVAAVAGPQFSVVSGGIACVVGALILARTHRPFYDFDSSDPGAI